MAELGVSTVLAGGLLAVYRRLRQRRAARGVARSRALRRLELAEGLLARTAEVPLTHWAASILQGAAVFIAEHDLPGSPVALELSAEDGAELLWDQPNEPSVSPWNLIDGGWSWHAPFDDDAHVDDADLPVAVPALVTIGKRDGRDLLVDLEAFGALTVTGDRTLVEDLVRSMTTELGAGEDLSNAYGMLVGLDLALADHLPRVSTCTEQEAIERLRSTVSRHRAVMDRANVASTFQLRGAPPFGREATVFIVDACGCTRLDELIELASPRSAAAVILLADRALTTATIEVTSNNHATLALLGLEFEPSALAAKASNVVAAVFNELVDEDAVEADAVALPPNDGVPSQLEFPPPTPGEATLALPDAGFDWPAAEIEVDQPPKSPSLVIRVLGTPRVEHPAELGRLDVSLLAFVACRGGTAPDEQVIDAVWGGRAVSRATVHNRLSKIRSALGGYLQLRDKSDTAMRLTDDVATDLQLMAQLVHASQRESSGCAMALLREALDWIEGPPFDAAGYEWAFTYQDHAAACELIETAVLRCIDLALEARDTAAARQAAASGLRALRLNEPIYRARMRIEADAGNLAGVRSVFNELVLLLDELGDGYEPSEETHRLLQVLLSRRLSA